MIFKVQWDMHMPRDKINECVVALISNHHYTESPTCNILDEEVMDIFTFYCHQSSIVLKTNIPGRIWIYVRFYREFIAHVFKTDPCFWTSSVICKRTQITNIQCIQWNHRVLVQKRKKKKRFPSESKKLSKKVRINRKSHFYFTRALYS